MQYQYQTPWIMANYLLLRNNKESGPHSLDELMELGLKPYDLVWIQGKSAAWRYPSEVEELKPFAPVVEEQPYDRFYKKQTLEKKEEVVQQEVHAVAPEHEKYIPKKSVFVTMPGQKANPLKPVIKEQTPAVKEQNYIAPTPVQQIISVTENPVAAQVKYSQPLDEIKEMYVKTLQDRKQKIARKSFWIQNLKKAAVIFLLVAVGVIAGLIIKSSGSKSQGTAREESPVSSQQMTAKPLVNLPETNTPREEAKIIPPAPGENLVEEQPKSQSLQEPSVSKQAIAATKDKPVVNDVKKETALSLTQKETIRPVLPQGIETNPATGERNRKTRDESINAGISSNTGKNAFQSSEISGLVSLASNEYKKVAFGGIRNLELTVTNDSKYTLDKVIVELQYLKPSEEPLKTENIEFKSVGPKSTSTIRVPDTNRGIKVAYRIVNVKSRQMDEVASGN